MCYSVKFWFYDTFKSIKKILQRIFCKKNEVKSNLKACHGESGHSYTLPDNIHDLLHEIEENVNNHFNLESVLMIGVNHDHISEINK